jgi:hypothetical protein
MKMTIVTAWVHHQPATDCARAYFVGECEALPIRTNVAELAGELVEFYGDSRQQVIDQIISALQSRGLTGRLRVI